MQTAGPGSVSRLQTALVPYSFTILNPKVMSQVPAFHSKIPAWEKGKEVHHNNNRCTVGNNIESHNRVSGSGGRPLCQDCADLNRAGK
jgi:hypothetical protein